MSDNHPSDVRLDDNQNGTVTFATDVIATIVGLAVTEVEGVASMSGSSAGIADMFSRKATKNITKGVKVDLVNNSVSADITLTVEYGFPIPEVASGIQENVKKAVETMCGINVSNVNIHVIGISFENEMRAAKALDEQQKKMLAQAEAAKVAEAEAARAKAEAEAEAARARAEAEKESIQDEEFPESEDEVTDEESFEESEEPEEAAEEEE